MVAINNLEPSGQNPLADTLAARLSRNIAVRRRALGLTQAQLSERLGVDTETLSRFERGKHLPSLATLERLAGQLLTTVGELLAEQPCVVDDEALAVTSWLSGLEAGDRAFARGLLKQWCDYMEASRPAVRDGVKVGLMSCSEVASALRCRCEDLVQHLDNVLSLIEFGLEVSFRVGTNVYVVTSENVYVLYRNEPSVRDAVVARFPGCENREIAASKSGQEEH